MSVISELTQWSGSLAHLASDLGQAHQKYGCMIHKYIRTVHIYAAYDNPTIPTPNPITHHSSAVTFCRSRNGWIQSWKWRRWQGGAQQMGARQMWGRA
jgi:hypothetical protein